MFSFQDLRLTAVLEPGPGLRLWIQAAEMSNVIYVTWQDANRGEDVQLKIDSCHSITVRVMYSFMAPDSWQRTNKQTSWPELTERSRDILTACDWQTCQHRFIFDQCVIGRFLIQIRLTAVSKISTFMTWVVSLRASERPVSMSRLLRGFKSSQTCKHEELWYWKDQMNKCVATNKSSRKQRNVQQQKLHLLSLHFKKTFYSFSRNNSWFQAYQKEATKTEQVSAFNQWISTEATRWRSAKLISCQQSSKTQKQTWESIYRQPSNPSTIQTDSRVFLLEELFLPAEPRLSLQLPVLGLFKLISLRLPRGSI